MVKLLLRYFLLLIFIFCVPVKLYAMLDPGDTIVTSTPNKSICVVGGSMTLTAGVATAPTSTFQWFKNGAPVSPNGTNNTLVITDIGRYQVYVTTSPATSPVQYPFIDITASPVPISAFSHSPDNQCPTTPIQFTNTSTGTGLTYVWDFGDLNSGANNTATVLNPIHTFVGSSNGGSQTFIVKLTVTNSFGCSTTVSQTVNVNAPSALLDGPDATSINGQPYFKRCASAASTITFNNTSSTTGTNTGYTIQWGDGSPDFTSATFSSAIQHTYAIGTFTLNFIVTGPGGCSTAASYTIFVGSNPSVSFGNPGNTSTCTGNTLSFPITDVANNPPGTKYTTTFSDGSAPIVYTTTPPAFITHTFLKGSCGFSSSNGTTTFPNSFSVSILASNPCGISPSQISAIYISQAPKAASTASADTSCVNNTVTYQNTSSASSSVSTDGTGTCSSGKGVWSVSPSTGFTVASGSLGSEGFSYSSWVAGSASLGLRFTTPGTYTVKLKIFTGDPNCGTDEVTKTICINALPTASFSVDNSVGCGPVAVQTTNNSPLPYCGNNRYAWTVTYSGTGCTPGTSGFTYTNGTSATSINPAFIFTNPGTYTLGLVTTNPGGACASTKFTQTITVKAKAIVTLNGITDICQNKTISPTVTVVSCNSTATYAWTFQGGSPSSSSSATPGNITYSTPGSYTVTLDVTNDCGVTTTTKTINVSTAPVVTVPTSLVLCNNEPTGNLSFNSTLTGTTYTWTNSNTSIGLASSGTGNIVSFLAKNTGATQQVATISVTPTSGCAGTPTSFTITVNPRSAAPVATTSLTYCLNDAASALTATALSGNTLTWYNNVGQTGGSATAPVPGTASAGQTKYYVTQSNSSGCESPATIITVTVNPALTNNTVGNDQGICSGTIPSALSGTAILSGGSGIYSYQWQNSSDGVNFNAIGGATSAGYSPPALTTTTYYRRVITSGTCSSNSNMVTITVQGVLANYDIAAAQTICSGTAPASLTGQSPTGGNGTYTYQWESSLNGTTWSGITGATGIDYQPPALTSTTYYRRNVYSNICSSVSTVVKITVNPIATISAVSNQYFCNGSNTSSINFVGTPGAGTTFAWTNDNTTIGLASSGTGGLPAFLTTNTTKALITATIQVTPVFTANSVSCTGTPISFTITVLPNITVAAGINTNYCAGTAVPAFVPVNDAATFTGGSVSYKWTVSSAIGLTAGNGSQIPAFTALNSGTTDVVATIQLTPVYTYQGHSCDGTPMSYTITVNPKPTTSNAGTNDKTCDIVYNLKGNLPAVGTGTWTVTSGPSVTFANLNSATSNVSDLQKGTRYQFTWTISNQTCAVNTSTMTLDVLTDVINTISADNLAICPNQQVNFSTATLSGGDIPGTLTASYTYIWESSANGTTWQTLTGQTASTLTVNPATTTYYRRKVRSYGQCEVTSNPVQIVVNATAPTANAGTAMTLCSLTQVQLQGNDPGTGFVGTWTDSATGSLLTFSPDAYAYNATVSGLVPGQTYHLVWAIASPSCGTTTSQLMINDLPTLTSQIGPLATTICAGQPATLTGVTPTGGTGTYTFQWERSTDQLTWNNIASQTGANLTVSPNSSTYYRRNVISGSCNLESNSVQVIVQQALSNNILSGTQAVCTGQPIAVLNGSAPAGGDGVYFYQWQQSTDQISWSNIPATTGTSYQPSPLTQSTYYRRIVTTALCTGPQSLTSAAILVTINQNAKSEFNASALSGCIPFNLATVITPVAHNDVNSIYQWYANGTLIGAGSSFPGYTITADGQSVIIKLIATSKFGCDTNSRSMTFTSNKNVTAAFTKDQVKGCGPLTVRFTNISSPLAGATYSWDFGNGQTSAASQPGPVTFAVHPLNKDTTYVITLRASTSCGTSIYKDSVTVRPKPKAIFTPDKTVGCSPFTVHMTNQSRGLPNQYTYDFGDGVQQTVNDNQAVQHTYNTIKTDTVTLKLYARNECGVDSSSYQIVIYPNTVTANLVVNGTNLTGCAPYTVRFDNNSTGANTFFYDFADGTTTASSLSPESQFHTFTQAGTYVVKLTASNGCSTASATQTITVLAQLVTGFKVNALQYCAKETASFTNTTTNPSAFSYVWDFGDGNTSNQINATHAYAAAGQYHVRLTAIQNAPGATCSATTTHDVTILALPVATFTSNSGGLNCAPFVLSVSSTPANASSVSWNFGDGSTASGYTAQHTFSKAGLYAVKQFAYNQTGCLDSTIQVVRITESPKAAFTTKDTIICGNSASLVFTNTTSYGGNDQVNYKWYVNGALASNQQNFTYNFTAPLGTILPYTLKIKLVSSSTIGCPDSVSHNIVFNPLPVAGYTVANTIACAPFNVLPTNTSVYADTYRWYLNNVLVSSVKTPANIILKQASQTYTLKLVTTNIYACKADSITKTLSTYPKPTAAFSLTDSISCTGQLAIKVNNNSSGAISYTWDFGDSTPASSVIIPTHTYGVPGIYTLKLIAFNGTCRDTATHQIEIANPVKSAFTANVLKGCTQVSTTFQNLAVNASSYLWDFGDGTFSTAKNPTHVFTYSASPFTIKMTAYGDYGCSDQSVQLNYITVTAPPVVDFAAVPDSVINIPNHTFDFKNSSTGGTNYNWDFGDTQNSTAQAPSHTYADTGTFKVRLTVTNAQGCQSYRLRTVKISGVPQYLFVPNAFEPGNARTELQTFGVRATGLAEYRLRIYNKWGQLIYQTTLLDSKGVPTQSWDGSINGQPAPQGVYVWDIQARFLDGTLWHGMNYNDGRSVMTSGSITLMR